VVRGGRIDHRKVHINPGEGPTKPTGEEQLKGKADVVDGVGGRLFELVNKGERLRNRY